MVGPWSLPPAALQGSAQYNSHSLCLLILLFFKAELNPLSLNFSFQDSYDGHHASLQLDRPLVNTDPHFLCILCPRPCHHQGLRLSPEGSLGHSNNPITHRSSNANGSLYYWYIYWYIDIHIDIWYIYIYMQPILLHLYSVWHSVLSWAWNILFISFNPHSNPYEEDMIWNGTNSIQVWIGL